MNLPDQALPQLPRDMLTITDILDKDTGAVIDLAAVVFDVGQLQRINCQDGRQRKKRNVTLVDNTHKLITLGLWPEYTDQLDDFEGRAAVFQNLQVREYQGKSMLSSTLNTIISTSDTQEEVRELNEWFAEEGCTHEYEEL